MPPTPLLNVYCTEADIQSLLSQDGEVGRLDDWASGSIDSAQRCYLTQAINWASARVNFYCAAKYTTADLATSWIVNQWATVLACDWLSRRRGNPSPFSDLLEDVMQDMKDIRSGEAQFSDIGLRTAAWPAWSNVRVDTRFPLRKIRVERVPGMSEMTNAPYPKNDDLIAPYIPPPF